MKQLPLYLVMVSTLLAASLARADGVVIDKIYHPYVDALEHELEYRVLVQEEQHAISTQAQIHKLSLGTTLGSRMFAEAVMIGSKSRGGTVSVEAVEAELKWQLTEQGEYGVDWGLLVEYEHERRIDAEEFALGLLAEKEWGKWSGTANVKLINEWGDDINSEVETMLALQARYRYSRLLEPAIEFYAGQNTRGIGPSVQGTIVAGLRKSVHWQAGLIFGLDNNSADQSWRFQLEYEF